MSAALDPWPEGLATFHADRYQSLVRVSALTSRRRDVAEDVVQEVMVQMAHRWDAIDHPVTSARTAVVSLSRSALRRYRREQPTGATVRSLVHGGLHQLAKELS